MAVLIIRGEPGSIPTVFVLMLVATLIDATDGTLARAVRIKEVLPGFDGRRLDDLVDFLTYVFLPLLLLWQARADLLPNGMAWVLLIPLFASAYGFCQVDAKTSDGFFLGFPSYWNLVAFYVYLLRLPTWLNLAMLLLLALLTFVPSRYLYPTQRGWVNRVSNFLALPWALLLIWIIYRLHGESDLASESAQFTHFLTALSLYYPGYYLVASWLIGFRLSWGSGRRPDEQRGLSPPCQPPG